MSGRTLMPWALAAGLAAGAGCLPKQLGEKDSAPNAEAADIPVEVAGTVAEYAGIVGGGSLLLDGHGLVVGLGNNGSSEVPPQLRKYLVEYMLKEKVGSALAGTEGVTPSKMLADKDTAVVRMVGVVPPGAPKGWKFDVHVTTLPQSGTRSLDGGMLYPFSMYVAQGVGRAPASGAREWARAAGSVFVNPFIDPTKPGATARLREGRIIGGGTVTYPRPLRLILREPDYARANVIQRRINQRFGGSMRVANAKNPSLIDLRIPPEYIERYEHFLQLVLHLPLQSDPRQWEIHARRVAAEMVKPGANREGLSLVWEAMGNSVVEVCRRLYTSRNAGAAFYAARAGVRLQDRLAGDVLIRFAETAGSPFQVPAIEELGRNRWLVRSIPTLRRLIDDPSELVRIAAYEALVNLGDTALIERKHIGTEFVLDLVTSRRGYVIYATQTLEKRIVLFGRDMTVQRRVFFTTPDDMLTICNKTVMVDADGRVVDPRKSKDTPRGALKPVERLMAFRVVPRTGGITDPFYTSFFVRDLIARLGQPAVMDAGGEIMGLNLTYGQVVAVLYRMCELEKDIRAKFVLQPAPGAARILRTGPSAGRPDMPG